MFINYLSKSTWFKRLLSTIVIFPFVLVWGELFTRELVPQNVDTKMDIFAADPVIGFKYKPNANSFEKGKEYNAPYFINSVGLRDREYGSKKENTFRVLLLGDSYSVSHGLPIDKSLSRQLENALQKVANSEGRTDKFEVINGAAGGYSPYNYWKAYLRWSPIFNPDAVVVGLSHDDYDCWNENLNYQIENGEIIATYRNGEKLKEGKSLSVRKIRKWLSWNSEFYVLMRNYFYYNDLVSKMLLKQSPGGLEDDYQLKAYMVSNKDKASETWYKAFSYLKRLKEETAKDGVELILIRIPMKIEIDSQQYELVLKLKNIKKEQIDLYQTLKIVKTFSDAENLPVLDPGHAMRERQATVPCFFMLDGHWNADGIKTASASIAEQWRKFGISPWKN